MIKRCRLCKRPVVEGSMFCEVHRAQAEVFASSFGGPGSADEAAPALPETPLGKVLGAAYERICERAKEGRPRDAERWPQVSVYYLADELLARPYYSVIPRAGDAPKTPSPFAPGDELVRAAIGPGGVAHERLESLFAEHDAKLRDRSVQTLDLHFLTFAGLLAINVHLPSQHDKNLATFACDSGTFTPIEAAEARPRLRHLRW